MSVLPNNSVGLCNFILKKNQNDQKFQLLELFNKKKNNKITTDWRRLCGNTVWFVFAVKIRRFENYVIL